jgi:4-aminobutyrate aminotransferase-like enzyme/Ser/Thr protein kinase RdoA (MazF antagonist)
MEYNDLVISKEEAKLILHNLYDIIAEVSPLAGEIDFNFKAKTSNGDAYVLKISRPDCDEAYIEFQDEILEHLSESRLTSEFPRPYKSETGQSVNTYLDRQCRERLVRLLDWVDGDLLSSVKYKNDYLLRNLGTIGGEICQILSSFDHDYAKRKFDWDIAQGLWIEDYIHLLEDHQKSQLIKIIDLFKSNLPRYQTLRKQVIHNDANDNNVVIKYKDDQACVTAIIDYGDAIYSQAINDIAVTITYAVMGINLPLEAACKILSAYHEEFPFTEEEIMYLYQCVAMRLAISVIKSAINRQAEPDNVYLQISDAAAWRLIDKWLAIDEHFANYSFRHACGWVACVHEEAFLKYAKEIKLQVHDFLPDTIRYEVKKLDLSIDSKFLGHYTNYHHSEYYSAKIDQITQNNKVVLVGGYGEARPLYTTDEYKVITNSGIEHRTIHIGLDFWTVAGCKISAVEDGQIFSIHNNLGDKDYGPTVIVSHEINNLKFFTLYGHLSKATLSYRKVGDIVKKGEIIGFLGDATENGNWSPHLHFQIILDMLDCHHDFYGVSRPNLWPIYKSICPDPNLLLKNEVLIEKGIDSKEILHTRKKNLGRSLSISYQDPLHIVRGHGQYLIDQQGRKYLDTVNNVAHVGHEHPKVIEAAINQISLLNTNTRYLHEEITSLAQALLATLPNELSVVHFVNSGSEANELAMRMAKTYTGSQEMIALEIGYHGNTQGCIDVSSYKFDGKGGKGKPPHTHLIPLPDSFRGKYRGQHAGSKYAAEVDEILSSLVKKGLKPAAMIEESIVSCGGQVNLPEGFLKAAYANVRAHGGLCIADEVQTGFGRVGSHFWAFELHGVIPDIVTLGKPFGNGHPLGAVVCTPHVADVFANGMEYFNTFGGNPVSCAIGNAVLEVIKNEELQANALQLGNYLKENFIKLASHYQVIKDVRGSGLFLGLEFCDDDLRPQPMLTSYLVNEMKAHGILMSIDGADNNVLKIKPPMCINKNDADQILDCMDIILSR